MATAQHQQTLKSIIVGDSGVGKTSVMNQFDKKIFSSQENEYVTKEVLVDDSVVAMQITIVDHIISGISFLDLCHRLCHLRETDCCILIFDVTAEDTYKNMKSYYEGLSAITSSAENFQFFVFANKIDEENRKVSKAEAQQWCQSMSIKYFETSAKDLRNIELAFQEVTRNVLVKKNVKGFNDEGANENMRRAGIKWNIKKAVFALVGSAVFIGCVYHFVEKL